MRGNDVKCQDMYKGRLRPGFASCNQDWHYFVQSDLLFKLVQLFRQRLGSVWFTRTFSLLTWTQYISEKSLEIATTWSRVSRSMSYPELKLGMIRIQVRIFLDIKCWQVTDKRPNHNPAILMALPWPSWPQVLSLVGCRIDDGPPKLLDGNLHSSPFRRRVSDKCPSCWNLFFSPHCIVPLGSRAGARTKHQACDEDWSLIRGLRR